MIGDALGVAPEDHPTLLQWSDDLMRGQGSAEEARRAGDAGGLRRLHRPTSAASSRTAGLPRDDLMSVLVEAEVDGDRLDDDEVMFESLLILIGGDETTRHVITGGLYQLLADRTRWERLRADRTLMPTAVEESLRWVSPIKNMARTATRDVDARRQGRSRKARSCCSSTRRPTATRRLFPDPMTFDITRSPNEHVAFGFGPHFCLGASLARLELRVAFERLADRLPDLALVDEAEPAFRPANFVSGYESMPVAFTPAPRMGA